jgi:DNA-binding MarR family transcriptional regulator
MSRSQRRSQAPGIPRPGENTVALLGQAYSALGHKIVAGVVEAGFPQRPAHSGVFAHIDVEGGTRLTELARRANITPQAMGELVDDLERMGYVTRRPDPEDRRAKLIVLTARGVACVEAAFETIARLEGRLDRLLGKEEVGALREALHRIVTAEGANAPPH